jgi:stearoyl-CoA desaturase (Delta-9 desaturase)
MAIIALFVVHWFASIFFQSSFQHRYAAHRMFTMDRVTERVFHFLTWASQGASYLPPYAYAILHREHHAFSDTAKDPHSPSYSPNVMAMMWKTAKRFTAHVDGVSKPEARFLGNYPEWRVLDRVGSWWTTRIAWGGIYIGMYLWLATAWWQFLLLPFHFAMGPIHGAIVNWCGHRYGYRNFKTRDQSRNSLPIDLITWGELFQNNHHHASSRVNFAWHKYEVDVTYHILRLLDRLRVIRLESESMRAAA